MEAVVEMRVGVVGCAGRMGRMLVRELVDREDCVLAGGTERPESPAIGRDIGELAGTGFLDLKVGDDPALLFADCEAVLDFTSPEATAAHAGLAAQGVVAHIIGTTGLGKAEDEAIKRAARHTAIVRAANMSLGINVLLALTEQVARTLGDDYDIEILEMHHRDKVDAPSGTALALGQAAAEGRGVALDKVARNSREGHIGARRRGDIGFAALRGGDVVGDHTVIFAGDGERIELTHLCASRQLFARGAVRAALWSRGKPPGLYGMRDVLGLG